MCKPNLVLLPNFVGNLDMGPLKLEDICELKD